MIPEQISRDILSTRENDFFVAYNDLLSSYSEEQGVDLTSDIEVTIIVKVNGLVHSFVYDHKIKPPKDLLIEVRALKSCGEVMTEGGPITLEKGSTHFVRRYQQKFNTQLISPNNDLLFNFRTDVEQYIRRGLVAHVQSEAL